jgi:hypothetical protein
VKEKIWVTNGMLGDKKEGQVYGKPKPTKEFTVKELIAWGVVGIYEYREEQNNTPEQEE